MNFIDKKLEEFDDIFKAKAPGEYHWSDSDSYNRSRWGDIKYFINKALREQREEILKEILPTYKDKNIDSSEQFADGWNACIDHLKLTIIELSYIYI